RGVDDLAVELLRASKARHIGIREIAIAVDQELRGKDALIGVNEPSVFIEVEHCPGHAGVEPDVFQHPEFRGHGTEISVDLFAALQALCGEEWLEAER